MGAKNSARLASHALPDDEIAEDVVDADDAEAALESEPAAGRELTGEPDEVEQGLERRVARDVEDPLGMLQEAEHVGQEHGDEEHAQAEQVTPHDRGRVGSFGVRLHGGTRNFVPPPRWGKCAPPITDCCYR